MAAGRLSCMHVLLGGCAPRRAGPAVCLGERDFIAEPCIAACFSFPEHLLSTGALCNDEQRLLTVPAQQAKGESMSQLTLPLLLLPLPLEPVESNGDSLTAKGEEKGTSLG